MEWNGMEWNGMEWNGFSARGRWGKDGSIHGSSPKLGEGDRREAGVEECVCREPQPLWTHAPVLDTRPCP